MCCLAIFLVSGRGGWLELVLCVRCGCVRGGDVCGGVFCMDEGCVG